MNGEKRDLHWLMQWAPTFAVILALLAAVVPAAFYLGSLDQRLARVEGRMEMLVTELRDGLAELRTELRGEMAELRGEMADLRTELRGEMADLRAELRDARREDRGDVAKVRDEVADVRERVTALEAASLSSLSGKEINK